MSAALPLWFAVCALSLGAWQWLDLWLLREDALKFDFVLVPFDSREEHAE